MDTVAMYFLNFVLACHDEGILMAGNGLRVAAVGDFGALHCQPAQKFDRSTQLQLCTSPPIEATRCYHQCFLVCRVLSFYLLLRFSLSFVVRWGIFKISFPCGLALQAL